MSRFFRSSLVLVTIMAILSLGISVKNTEAGGGPTPVVTIGLPITAIYGHQPIDLGVKISNPYNHEVTFDGSIWQGGPAWGWETYGYTVSQGTEVYWTQSEGSGTNSGLRYFWRGTIAPQSAVLFSLPTFTGPLLGTYTFAMADFLVNGIVSVNASAQITLTQGTMLRATLEEIYPLVPGSYNGALRLKLESPTLTQFTLAGPMTSRCDIQGLPANIPVMPPYTYDPNRTYFEYSWWGVKPAAKTAGNCTIRGTAVTTGGTEVPFELRLILKPKGVRGNIHNR